MSFRDDVILRMIKQLVEAILRQRRLRREKGDEMALEQSGEDFEAWIGVPRAVMNAATPDTLVALLSPMGRLDVGRAHAMARWLDEQAGLHDAVSDDTAAARARGQRDALMSAARDADAEMVARLEAETDEALR